MEFQGQAMSLSPGAYPLRWGDTGHESEPEGIDWHSARVSAGDTARMTSSPEQKMKPITAAKKLGIHLPSAPEEFRNSRLTRAELAELAVAELLRRGR